VERSDRLRAIVRMLVSRPRTTVAELVQELKVSARTVYRDIDLLHRLNVPIAGEPGVGYHLHLDARGYHLHLDVREALAVLEVLRESPRGEVSPVAERLAQALPDVAVEALS
jgi:predicted DNA-binding transcriptional regulator YafY